MHTDGHLGPGQLGRWVSRSENWIPVGGGGGAIFRTRPERPWGPPNFLHNGYRVSFPGVKLTWHGVNHPLPWSAEAKERLELYRYSPSGASWPVLGRTLPFTFIYKHFARIKKCPLRCTLIGAKSKVHKNDTLNDTTAIWYNWRQNIPHCVDSLSLRSTLQRRTAQYKDVQTSGAR